MSLGWILVAASLLGAQEVEARRLTALAEARLVQGETEAARKLLLQALTISPSLAEPNTALGDLLLKERRYPEAMDRFETALSSDLKNVHARRGELAAATELAVTSRAAGHPEVALAVLQHARTRLPDDGKLLLALGIQAGELHLSAEATEALDAARRLNPHDPDTLYALASAETDQQRVQAAEADLRAYLAVRPKDASAHFGLGHVLAMEVRTDEARAEFERSIQLQPVQTESYYQIGQIELDAHQDAKAEPLFRKTLTRDPTHGGALTGMGVLAFRAREYARAEQYLAAAEKTAPHYAPAHYYRGLALARLGRKDEADSELRAAAELNKTHPVASAMDIPSQL